MQRPVPPTYLLWLAAPLVLLALLLQTATAEAIGHVNTFPVPNGAAKLSGIVYNAAGDGNLWFTETNKDAIGRLSADGALTEFTAGITPGAGPSGITAAADGTLWFTERDGNRIGKITPAGVITEYSTGLTPGAIPLGIAAAGGDLWFTETAGNRIGKITPAGVITEYSTGITANAAPYGITAGPDGNVWFTELSGDRIGSITPTGTVTEFSSGITSGAAPTAITSAGGNLWFTERDGDRIGRITTAGVVTQFSSGITPGAAPTAIALGSDNALWFTENGVGQIGRITTAGAVTEYGTAYTSPIAIAAGPGNAVWFTEGDQAGNSPAIGQMELRAHTTVSGGPAPATTENSASFSFSADEENATFKCSLDGGTAGSCISPKSYTNLADGHHTFAVYATTSGHAGNPTTTTWTVDRVAPATPTQAGPKGGTITSALPTFTWTPATDAGSGLDHYDVLLDGSDSPVGTVDPATCTLAQCTWTEDSPLSSGLHSWRVRVTDKAGNVTTTGTAIFSVDDAPPSDFTLVSPADGSATKDATPNLSWNAASDAGSGVDHYEVFLDNVSVGTTTATSKTVSSALAEGGHSWYVVASDAVGNTKQSATNTFTVDTTPPTTSISSHPGTLTNSGDASFEFYADDPDATFKCQLDAGATQTCTSPKTYNGLPDGSHTFKVHARDAAGNTEASPQSYTWTVDATAPTKATLITPAGGGAAAPNVTFTWSPSTDDSVGGVVSYEVLVDSNSPVPIDPSACTPTCSWSSPSQLSDGPHSWRVRATDAAGNVSTSDPVAFSVDAAPPTAFLLTGPSNGAAVNTPHPHLSWQAATDADSGIDRYGVVVDNVRIGTTTSTAYDPPAPLGDGLHSWYVVASDKAGNTRNSSTGSFTVDTTPPVAKIVPTPNPAHPGFPVQLQAFASTDAGGPITRYEWDADGDGTFETDTGAVPTLTHSYADVGNVNVHVRVTDQVGLTAVASALMRVTSATGGGTDVPGVTINDNARYTRSTHVTLKITPPNPLSSQMAISNEKTSTPDWRQTVRTVAWNIDPHPASDGVDQVFVYFRAGSILQGQPLSDEIILDPAAPVLSSVKASARGKGRVSLQIKASDRLSGVASVVIARKGATAKTLAFARTITLPARRGQKLTITVIDGAGNRSRPRTVRA